MESKFNNQDFEKLLRDNANQYRMYPSEKVWNGVHAALHTRRKWYRISAMAMLLLSGTAITLLVLNYTADKAMMTELDKSSPVLNSSIPSSKLFFEKNNFHFAQPEITLKTTALPAVREPQIVTTKKTAITLATSVEKSNIQPETLQEEVTNESATVEIIQNETGDFFTELSVPDLTPAEKIFPESDAHKINEDARITGAVNALASLEVPLSVKSKNNGLSFQVYLTPTVSYRKLKENKSPYANNSFNSYRYLDVNNIVNHKPAMGFEFGLEGKYRLNKNVSLKSGIQFNINRYDIRAYSSPTEIATVAVSSGYRTNYMSTLSNYRNFSGYTPNWLENFYFQAALPMGTELALTEKKNFNFGISVTLQPTYVIGDRAYMISSDYKNYAEFPDLMRRWNLSTGFETFVSYKTGKVQWQTGPHVRYQFLSSYVSGYPVKENLFAVGLKVAATFNQ
ncbi:MAG TPA: hypothetical protein VI548_10250 [Chitinophagaceae bacterium]|nr:hypothetical protein [Chitinophagaceae bacterium]